VVLPDTENVEAGIVGQLSCGQDLLQSLTRADLLPDIGIAQELRPG